MVSSKEHKYVQPNINMNRAKTVLDATHKQTAGGHSVLSCHPPLHIVPNACFGFALQLRCSCFVLSWAELVSHLPLHLARTHSSTSDSIATSNAACWFTVGGGGETIPTKRTCLDHCEKTAFGLSSLWYGFDHGSESSVHSSGR